MDRIGRYAVISELGRGAMGIVYRASDPTIGREVALKVLTLTASHDEGTNSPQDMFMREVRAAGRLAHPSIVTIHDAFDDPESQASCIVMELVRGMTLEKMLGSGVTLPIEQVLSMVRQVAEGLDYAHRNQVIHRDLKPANILVTEEGRVKITDFGIAKVLAREAVARTVGILGTPSYMSPEQVKGSDIDARTDIFSLGIIFFTMVTGQKPFSGNTATVMFKIVYEEPLLPSSLNARLTPAYDHVIRKCLAKDRNLRYSSARELVADLDDLQHGRQPRSQAAVVPAVEAAVPAGPQMKAMPMPSSPHAATPPAMPPPVSNQPPVPVNQPAVTPPPGPGAPPSTGQATPAPVPGHSAVMPVAPLSPEAVTISYVPEVRTMGEPALPHPGPDSAESPPVAVPQPGPRHSAPQPATAPAAKTVSPSGAVLSASKSKLNLIIYGVGLVVLLAVVAGGYRKLHHGRTVPSPAPQAVVQPQPVVPPPVATSSPTSSPPPASEVKPETPSVTLQPRVTRKPHVRRSRPAAAPQPVAPSAPAQPESVAVAPPHPASPLPAPGPNALAKTEAPKLAAVPRVVVVHCHYDLKEATFTFTSQGQTLLQETLKAQKKGGFLGIKGSYDGTFSHTITVPAGAPEVSLHVVAREGATNLSRSIKMPPAGGFVPTLAVEVDSDHISFKWKSSAGAK